MGSATYTKPPNHRLFDPAIASLFLEARRKANEAKNAPAPTTAPISNIVVPGEIANVFRPAGQAAPAGPAPPADTGMLVPPGFKPGPSMPIAEFAQRFNLHPDTLTALQEAKFRDAAELGRLFVSQCTTALNLALGQSAKLVFAVEQWAQQQ